MVQMDLFPLASAGISAALLTLPAAGPVYPAAGSGCFLPRCWLETDGGGSGSSGCSVVRGNSCTGF